MPEKTADSAVPVVGPLGHALYVDADDQRGQLMIQTAAQFNPESLVLWDRALRLAPWEVVADIGSNYGQMLACVDLGDFSAIYAFEPNQRLLPYLSRTIGALPWQVRLIDAGVADQESDSQDFTVDLTWSGTSTLGDHLQADAAGHEFDVQSIRTVTVDGFFGPLGVRSACIKIDVEGHEAQVLAGARRFIESVDAVAVMFEILHMSADEVRAFSAGFELYLLDLRREVLVRVEPDAIEDALAGGWLYRQDAVIVRSGTELDGLTSAVAAAGAREELLRATQAELVAAEAVVAQQSSLEPAPAAGEAADVARDAEIERLRGELAAWHASRSYRLTTPLRGFSSVLSSFRRNTRP